MYLCQPNVTSTEVEVQTGGSSVGPRGPGRGDAAIPAPAKLKPASGSGWTGSDSGHVTSSALRLVYSRPASLTNPAHYRIASCDSLLFYSGYKSEKHSPGALRGIAQVVPIFKKTTGHLYAEMFRFNLKVHLPIAHSSAACFSVFPVPGELL